MVIRFRSGGELTPNFSTNELERSAGMSASQVVITTLPATAATTRPQRVSVSVRGGRDRLGGLPIGLVESAFRMLRTLSMRSAGCLPASLRSGGADGVAGLVCSEGGKTLLVGVVVSAMLGDVGVSPVWVPRRGFLSDLCVSDGSSALSGSSFQLPWGLGSFKRSTLMERLCCYVFFELLW